MDYFPIILKKWGKSKVFYLDLLRFLARIEDSVLRFRRICLNGSVNKKHRLQFGGI